MQDDQFGFRTLEDMGDVVGSGATSQASDALVQPRLPAALTLHGEQGARDKVPAEGPLGQVASADQEGGLSEQDQGEGFFGD